MNNDNSCGDSRDAFSNSLRHGGGALLHTEPFVSFHQSQDVSTVVIIPLYTCTYQEPRDFFFSLLKKRIIVTVLVNQ